MGFVRVYFAATVDQTEAILANGFTDLHRQGDTSGVLMADQQLDVNDGFEGEVTLCLDMDADAFARYEWIEEGAAPGQPRKSLIPAEVLNKIGRPKIYDHTYAGASRRDMVKTIKELDQYPQESSQKKAQEMREAISFFDDIGWLTPVKVRCEQFLAKLPEGGDSLESGIAIIRRAIDMAKAGDTDAVRFLFDHLPHQYIRSVLMEAIIETVERAKTGNERDAPLLKWLRQIGAIKNTDPDMPPASDDSRQ